MLKQRAKNVAKKQGGVDNYHPKSWQASDSFRMGRHLA